MKKPISLTLLAIFLVTGCSSASVSPLSKEEQARVYYESGASSLNEGDPTGALILLKKAAELEPKMAEIHYMLTLTYFQKGETALAIQSAKKALQVNPDLTAAKNALGKLLLDQGKFDEAEKYLKESANDLTYREAYLAKTNLGLLYSKKQKPTEAEYWYSKAIFDAGNASCVASFQRGMIYFNRNDLEKAKPDFYRASKNLCGNNSEAHLAYGKTLVGLKKFDQARSKMLEIQQLFPQSAAADKANEILKDIP